MRVSAVIPTLNASRYIVPLLERLEMQSMPVQEVVVIDSASSDDTLKLISKFSFVKVVNVTKETFNHGGTRDLALQQTSGDVVLFLTQDALPIDEHYVENLVRPISADESVAMASGRQVAREDAVLAEKLTREFNYPKNSFVRSKDDLPRLGIKTFFASDCCSAYRRSAYEAIGGFEKDILVNEDMEIAARFIYGGYKIAYAADAAVYHSHNYTLKQQFARNFDIAVFIQMHPNLYGGIPITSEGVKMVKFVLVQLLSRCHFILAIRYVLESAAKLYGNRMGKKYRTLSKDALIRYSMNKKYWEKY